MLMDREEFDTLVADEASAERYLLRHCWENHQRFCPRCKSRKNYRLKSGRRRCARCRYTFHDFSGRWINNCNLTCRDWLRVMHLFAAEATAQQVARELGLSYNTAYKAVNTLRFSILAHALDAKQMLGENSCLGLTLSGRMLKDRPGPCGKVETPVFGIMDRREWVFVDLIPGFDAETILHFQLNFQLAVVRQGNVTYTDRYQRYDTLICCVGNSPTADYIKSSRRGVSIDGAPEGFWRYAGQRLLKYHGVTPQRFPLYLKELEFRYNSRTKDLLPLLAACVCDFVPELP
ncbi:IS1595 family transposase [Desulfocurvus vexinensis]|uniref:IS1595 family transposase n=1 Tax=Desulfocurvus vexinensis TaxID=399548 RepID=UPI0004AE4D45|nr:IS1595 family transposase [Desulfocurvus vexinensis]